LKIVVDNVRAAGIEVVAAAQNAGPSCSTIRDPIGIYDSAFTVGATDSSDTVAGFSSRGPVISDGSGRRKPDISAPGVSVRSTYPTNSWGYLSGTSMATPHVVGLFALIWSAAPELTGHLSATENIITSAAIPLTTAQGCGDDTPTSVPNNVYGWGRIDALAAIQTLGLPVLQLAASASSSSVFVGQPLTFTFVVANPSHAAHTNVIITDTLPPDVTFASASSNGIYAPTEQRVTWLAPTLSAQSSVTLTLAVTVGVAGSTIILPPGTLIVNHDYGARSDQLTHTVSGPPVTTTVQALPPPDLSIKVTAPAGPILPGDSLTYTFVVANPSQFSDHTNVVITDTLPLSVTFASALEGGSYSSTERRVTWLAPTLTAQTSLTFTLGVTAGLLPNGTWIVNRDYGARSDQVTHAVSGPPATTAVGMFPYIYYFPIWIAPPSGSAIAP